MDKARVAVVGLGSMGYGMAQSCLRCGHTTYGYDLNPEAVARLQVEGGHSGALVDVADSLDVVVVVVLNAAQTTDVLFGASGIVGLLRPGAVVISSATMAPEVARDLETRCESRGVHYLDAPISGGSVKAAAGQLSVMASGTPDAFAAARPVLDATAEKVFELGDGAGAGSAMKAANQLLAGVHIAAMAEAMTFAITQGIEPAQLVEVISECAGTSWMFENRAPHIVDGDYSPRSQINIWPKDLGIVMDIARDAACSTPLTAAALEQYRAAVDLGLGTEDDAAVAKVYARNAGVTLPAAGSPAGRGDS